MNDRRLRAVVVGAGVMGRHHADAIAHAGGDLVAVVDPVTDRARAIAGTGATATSLSELCRFNGTFDVVHVCAPLPLHAEIAGQALDTGAHVIVEKPLTTDAASTERLLEAAEERGLLVVPVHQFPFQRGVRRLLDAPERLGELVRCSFQAATAGSELTGLSAGELVADILPHPLALFVATVGPDVATLEWAVVRPAPGELRAVAHLGDVTLEIAISTRARPTYATFDVSGTRASLHADLFHGFATVERGTGTGLRKVTRPFELAASTLGRAGSNLAVRAATRQAAYPGLRELVRQVYDAIATSSPPPIPARDTLAVAVARDAILAAAEGRPGDRR